MRIKLTGTITDALGNESSIVRHISAGSGVDDPNGDLVVECANQMEIGSPLRAAYQKIFNRGLKLLTVSFSVSRQYSTESEAEYMAFEANLNQPMNCTAQITFGDGVSVGGQVNSPNAELEAVSATHIGVLVTIRYRLMMAGIQISKGQPFSPVQ